MAAAVRGLVEANNAAQNAGLELAEVGLEADVAAALREEAAAAAAAQKAAEAVATAALEKATGSS